MTLSSIEASFQFIADLVVLLLSPPDNLSAVHRRRRPRTFPLTGRNPIRNLLVPILLARFLQSRDGAGGAFRNYWTPQYIEFPRTLVKNPEIPISSGSRKIAVLLSFIRLLWGRGAYDVYNAKMQMLQ